MSGEGVAGINAAGAGVTGAPVSALDVPITEAVEGWLARAWPLARSGARRAFALAAAGLRGSSPVVLLAVAGLAAWLLFAIIGKVVQAAVVAAVLYAAYYVYRRQRAPQPKAAAG
jgi:hypothetical protein